MLFPDKEYERLRTLQERWDVSQEEILYAVENGLLHTCIWLPLRYIERGVMRNKKFIYETHEHKEGFVRVRQEDCRRICSTGRAKLQIFNSAIKDDVILRLAYEPPQPAISVRISDLVVLKKDREKFEETYDISENNVIKLHPEKTQESFIASGDYRYVKLDSKEYHFGDIQASVVEQLHDAAQSHRPWVHGKTLLHESGSSATRLRDLFKNNKDWNEVILSDKRGYYRLNIPLQMPADSGDRDITDTILQQSI